MMMSQEHSFPKAEELSQLPKEKLVEIIIAQQAQINQLTQEIERLKASLNLDSQTSSKPPSTDLLKKSEKEKPAPSTEKKKSPKRKPGGQPGHQGKTRKGFGRVDRYEITRPENCPHCDSQKLKPEAVKIEKNQVAQLVERPIEIVEYQRHHCQCQECGGIAKADLPSGFQPGQDLGFPLQGLLCWLGNYGHLSYKKQQEFLWELGEVEISLGTLVSTNERVQEALTPSVEALQEWINQKTPHLHSDETPWPVKGTKEWLWVLAGEKFCLFHAGDTRGRVELQTVLGASYKGVLISDDFSAYNGYPVLAQQKCLAHLRRHFQRLWKLKGRYNQVIAETFLDLIDEAFQQHRKWREALDGVAYRDWARKFRPRVEAQLQNWRKLAGYEAGKLLRSLREKADQWWYFLWDPTVPPDNNLAERCLRLAVTKRKVSGGSRSMARFRQTTHLLSVIQSCRLQGRSVITFFQQALQSPLTGEPCPSLIPQFCHT
jgi:transposase